MQAGEGYKAKGSKGRRHGGRGSWKVKQLRKGREERVTGWAWMARQERKRTGEGREAWQDERRKVTGLE